MPPALEHSPVCSIPLPALGLKYLTLNTHFLCGSALATRWAKLRPPARGAPASVFADTLTCCLVLLVFSPFLHLRLSFLTTQTPFFLAHSRGFSSFPRGSLASPEAPAAL